MMDVFMNMMVFVSFNARFSIRSTTLFLPRTRTAVRFGAILLDVWWKFLFQPTHHLRHGSRLVLLSVPVSQMMRRRSVPQNNLTKHANLYWTLQIKNVKINWNYREASRIFQYFLELSGMFWRFLELLWKFEKLLEHSSTCLNFLERSLCLELSGKFENLFEDPAFS